MNKIYIQCKNNNGVIGDFLRNEMTGKDKSPTFKSLFELIDWCKGNNIDYIL